MSKLNIDQKNIGNLFSDKKSDFLIPDYQRPYAWTDNECLTLWEDLFEFAFPESNKDKFNPWTGSPWTHFPPERWKRRARWPSVASLLSINWTLAAAGPGLSLCVRRCQDKAGGWG